MRNVKWERWGAMILSAGITLCAGCSFDKHVDISATKDINKGLKTFRDAKPKPPEDFEVSDSAWFAGSEDRVRIRRSEHIRLHIRPKHLPALFEKRVLLVSEKPIGIADITSEITTSTGLLVTVTTPRKMGISGNVSGLGGGMGMPMMGGSLPSGSTPAPSLQAGTSSGETFLKKKIRVDWDGSLEGLLDYTASRFGLFWTYRNHVVSFGRTTTKIFRINAAPVMNIVSNSISDAGMTGLSSILMNQGAGGGMGGGAGMMGGGMTGGMGGSSMMGGGMGGGMGGSGQNVSSFSISTVWSEISQSLKSILGGRGNYSIAQSAGTVTVTTTPRIMGEIAEYVHDLNNSLSLAINGNSLKKGQEAP